MEEVSLSVTCPNCGTEIPLTEAISQRFREESKAEFQAEAAKNKQLLDKREQELKAKEEEVEKAGEAVQAEVEKRLKADKKKLEEAAEKKAEEKLAVEMADMRGDLESKKKALRELQEAEIKLRQEKRELEDKKGEMELELARKFDEQKKEIEEQAESKATEAHKLKDREKDNLIDSLKSQLEDMQRKVTQRSQKGQGDALEDILEQELRANFPRDEIEHVGRGVRGADIIQRVRNSFGHDCGAIIWEAKNTKNWSEHWVDKLKENQIDAKAEVAVILTTAFPSEGANLCEYKGIWLCDDCSLVGMASVLRYSLIHVAEMTLANEGRTEKMEILYNYLSGPEFKQRVAAIDEAFTNMQRDLNSERKAMEKIWSKREKQISSVLKNTAALYGDMEGIIGTSMPQIGTLELDAIAAPEDGEAEEEF